MKCRNCGAEGDGNFCEHCGTPLKQVTGKNQAAVRPPFIPAAAGQPANEPPVSKPADQPPFVPNPTPVHQPGFAPPSPDSQSGAARQAVASASPMNQPHFRRRRPRAKRHMPFGPQTSPDPCISCGGSGLLSGSYCWSF